MIVYLFRHGETAGNVSGRYVGKTDQPLCDLGIETAQAAGSDPNVGEVIVSPLLRTQMTARLLFPNARQCVMPGLREMTFGDFEGRSALEMTEDPDYRYWVKKTECMGPCPHGDATMVFQRRVCAAFTGEIARAEKERKNALYFVIHGGAIMSIMHRFARPYAPYYSWLLKNCQGYRCKVMPGTDGLPLLLGEVELLQRVKA